MHGKEVRGLPCWIWCSSNGTETSCNAEERGSVPGREDPLKKEMATPYSILAWRIPWTEEPGELQSVGSQRVRDNLATKQRSLLCVHVHGHYFT